MPLMLSGILSFIWSITAPLLSNILRMIGLSIVTYGGLTLVIDQATDLIMNRYNDLPTVLLQLLDLAGVHSALKMMISTMFAVASFKSAQAATKAVWKKPTPGASSNLPA